MSIPLSDTVPLVGSMSRVSSRTRVDLPEPGQAHHHEHLARGDLEGDVLDPDHAVGLGLEVGAREVGVGRADDLVGAGSEDLPETVD